MNDPGFLHICRLLNSDGGLWYLPDDLYRELQAWLKASPKLRYSIHELKYEKEAVRLDEQKLDRLKELCEYNRLQREAPLPTDGLNDAFARDALAQVSVQARHAAVRRTGQLRSVLILPEGNFIRIPSDPGLPPDPCQRRPCRDIIPFGNRTIPVQLPPSQLLPRLPPLTCVEITAGRPNPPDRLHLVFGAGERLDALRTVAGMVTELVRTLSLPLHVFRCRRPVPSDDDQILDEWLCTLHWWLWKMPGLTAPFAPKTEFSGALIDVPPDSAPFQSSLVFSSLPWDLLRASAVVAAHLSALLSGDTGCTKAEIEFLTPPSRKRKKTLPTGAGESAPPLLQFHEDGVTYGEKQIDLQPQQLAILKELVEATRHTVSRTELAHRVWDDPPEKRTVNQAVSALRKALQSAHPGVDPILSKGRGDTLTWTLALKFRLELDPPGRSDAPPGPDSDGAP